MSQAYQFNETRAHQRGQSRAGQFGGGKKSKIPPAEGCKLVHLLTMPYKPYPGDETVSCPQFYWDDPQTPAIADRLFVYGLPYAWTGFMAIKPRNPWAVQLIDTFGSEMGFFGSTEHQCKLGDVYGSGSDDFGPFEVRSTRGPIYRFEGGRNNYSGWQTYAVDVITRVYDDNEAPGYLFCSRLPGREKDAGWPGQSDNNRPVFVSSANGPITGYIHTWDDADPEWRGEYGNIPEDQWHSGLDGSWPSGIGRGLAQGKRIVRDFYDGYWHGRFNEHRRGISNFSQTVTWDSNESRTLPEDEPRDLTYLHDLGSYFVDEITGQPMTQEEFIFEYNQQFFEMLPPDYNSARPLDQRYRGIDDPFSFPVIQAIIDDGYEFIDDWANPFRWDIIGDLGCNHRYCLAPVRYTREGSWKNKFRFAIIRISRDQYGILGHGDHTFVPTAYNYGTIGCSDKADLMVSTIAGK